MGVACAACWEDVLAIIRTGLPSIAISCGSHGGGGGFLLSRNRKKHGFDVVFMWESVVICGKICGLLAINFFPHTWPWMASFVSWCCCNGWV